VSNYSPSVTGRYIGGKDQFSYIDNDRNIKFDFIGKLESLNRDLQKTNQTAGLSDDLAVLTSIRGIESQTNKNI